MSAHDDATRERRSIALHALASRLLDEGHPLADRLSQRYREIVADAAATTAEELRAAHLPPTVKELAEEIAEVLVAATGSTDDRVDADEQAPSAESSQSDAIAVDATPTDAAAQGHGASETAPAPRRPPARPADPLSHLAFAPYDGTTPQVDVATITVSRTRSGGHSLSWPAGPAGSVDRLVSGDQHAPYTPDAAREVARTTRGAAEDDGAFQHALRHYQVWRHAGPDVAAAARTQPVLVARASIVAPPTSVRLVVDAGSVVTATWITEPGTTAVAVHRVPIEDAAAAGLHHPGYRILQTEDLLGGFADRGARPGRRYVYQLTAEVDGGTATSATIVREIEVPDVHEPVQDLAFDLREEHGAAWFDLSWSTPPGGTVQIYRSTKAPVPGYDHAAIASSALDAAGLRADDLLNHPIDRDGDRSSMRSVPWPSGWSKAFFTAVVTVGEHARLGNTATGIRVPPIGRVKVIERLEQQLVTFDFPDGANDVRLHVARRDVSAEAAIAGRETAVVSRHDYERFGSMRLASEQLAQPCTLHLVAAASHGSETVLSAIASVDYTPLVTLTYQLTATMGLTAASRRPKVTIAADRDLSLPAGMGFVLGFRADRLPLSVRDATAHIPVSRDEDPSGAAARFMAHQLGIDGHSGSPWKAEAVAWRRVASVGGYLRLFLDDARYQAHVALIDPPVASLRVTALLRR